MRYKHGVLALIKHMVRQALRNISMRKMRVTSRMRVGSPQSLVRTILMERAPAEPLSWMRPKHGVLASHQA